MKEKLIALQNKLEARKAAKEGAVAVETIVVTAIVLGIAAVILVGFGGSMKNTGSKAGTQVEKAATDMGTAVDNANAPAA